MADEETKVELDADLEGVFTKLDGLTLGQASKLVKALEDEDRWVRVWAINAIRKLVRPHFAFDARLPPGTQRERIEEIRDYLRRCGAL